VLLTREYDLSERRSLISVCMGAEEPDLLLTGGYVVDVAIGEIKKADIAVKGKRIAYVGDARELKTSNSTKVLDITGKYVAPGFIDAHAHVESTMLTPSAYASLIVPYATTGAVIDPHEVANVAGVDGLKVFLGDAKHTGFKFYVQAPSCVPSAPGLETAGHTLDSSTIQKLLGLEGVWGLGELMSYNSVTAGEEEILEKIRFAYEKGRIIDGHSPSLRNGRLQAYLSSGVMNDHTPRTAEEVLDRLRSGAYVMVQDRPGESLFEDIVGSLKKIDTRRVMFCTDDIEPDEVEERGHLVSLMRKAVALGLNPVKAVQMVTINAAEAYMVESELGVVAPGRYADLVLLNDLQKLNIDKVVLNGTVLASRAISPINARRSGLHRFEHTVKLRQGLAPDDLLLKVDVEIGRALVRVVTVEAGAVQKELTVSSYAVQPSPTDDIIRMAVLERHGRNGNIGKGFMQGTGLRDGAITTSISHDAHNIVSIGVSEQDMYLGVRELEKAGGGIIATMNGKTLAKVELPYFGLLTDDLRLSKDVRELRKAAADMGLKIPFRKVMFLSLPVGRGNFRITDMGLVSYADKTSLPVLLSLLSQQ